ncbi:hypothetical protein CONPUDRAFT_136412 [Coniophora puteana RWD-64-598 SS2]|uniref:Protein kinase domain-containing protein n=1 Tax=Coniophora puteana (strain RWD-64-598) TaxID=741705 RepID=A0A5M3MX70_CONPW|nr:uncharacterized protein CONPUDRAFT_136412 [Coniophora puteana RWD-64-598 SS2]EIW83364.1 hypothetical protein CONPUDRAFT_136412 [Coniophora puteana RWD-64-598 SS2]
MASSQVISEPSPRKTVPTTFMFSTLTITGSKLPNPITLTRSEDFPPHKLDFDEDGYVPTMKWCPSQGPQGAGHLSLKMGKRISGGGGGVAYEAEVLTSDAEGSSVTPSDPSPLEQKLCIKVARANRCRTLAREAWMYRKLSGLRGIIAPHFYGFFAVDLPETHRPFPPKDDLVRLERDDPTVDEFLPDDDPVDGQGGRDRSKWCEWRPNTDAPILAVLVMSRGGKTYSGRDHYDSSMREEVRKVLDDLSRASLLHGDLRPANLVRAPADTIPCDLHQCVHKWNVIDLARSDAVDIPVDNALYSKPDRTPEEEMNVRTWSFFVDLQQSGYKTEHFAL